MWTADDVICGDRFLSAFPNNYFKTDIFYVRGTFGWRGRIVVPPRLQQVIICGHSDYPLTDEIAARYPRATWFSTNTQSKRVNGLPLGITNDTDESPVHRIYGNIPMMVEVSRIPREIMNLVYLNFAVHTYPSERAPLKEMFSGVPWVTHCDSVNTFEGRRAFLQDVRNHTFVLCPRGNGIDTHRLWETLYMGSIPIVKRDSAHAGWTDLPILFVDDWKDITKERLLTEHKRIESTSWNMDKLKIGYWIHRIKQ